MKILLFVLMLTCVDARAACENLKEQLENYNTACSFAKDVTTGCTAFTPFATALWGPMGFVCSIPSVAASGVCALRDLKKRWYEECKEKDGRIHSWKMPTNTNSASNQYAALVRSEQMDENNREFEHSVDSFMDELKNVGFDITADENQTVIREGIAEFEREYIERRKEIDRQFRRDSAY